MPPRKELHRKWPNSVQLERRGQRISLVDRYNRGYSRASISVQFAFATSPSGEQSPRR
jgi:hypothetical protein